VTIAGQQDPAPAAVLRQALSVATAVSLYGISFGALAVASGLSVTQTCALSLLMFTGGSQFAYAGIAVAGGGAPAAVATAALVGIRNGFYALQLAPLLRPRGLRRLAAAQLTIDESTAVGSAQLVTHPQRPELARLGFWATGAGVYLLWNSTTAIGAVVGDQLGDPRRYGLDAAAAAAFLALLWPRLMPPAALFGTARVVALGAAGLALVLVPLAPAGVPVLAGAVLAVGIAWRERPVGSPPAATGEEG
jgi:predicted branched-subunit amino acid permease